MTRTLTTALASVALVVGVPAIAEARMVPPPGVVVTPGKGIPATRAPYVPRPRPVLPPRAR